MTSDIGLNVPVLFAGNDQNAVDFYSVPSVFFWVNFRIARAASFEGGTNQLLWPN